MIPWSLRRGRIVVQVLIHLQTPLLQLILHITRAIGRRHKLLASPIHRFVVGLLAFSLIVQVKREIGKGRSFLLDLETMELISRIVN